MGCGMVDGFRCRWVGWPKAKLAATPKGGNAAPPPRILDVA